MKKILFVLLVAFGLCFGQFGHNGGGSGNGATTISDTSSTAKAGQLYVYNGVLYIGTAGGHYEIVGGDGSGDITGVTAGSGLSGGGASGSVTLAVSGVGNTNIAANAAIAGSKISPVFGSQSVTNTGYAAFNGSAISQWLYRDDSQDSTRFGVKSGAKGGLGVYPNASGYSNLTLFQNNVSPRGYSALVFAEKNAAGVYRPHWGIGTDVVKRLVTADSLAPIAIPLFRWTGSGSAVDDMQAVNVEQWMNGADTSYVGQWGFNIVPPLKGVFTFGTRTDHVSSLPIMLLHRSTTARDNGWLRFQHGTSGLPKFTMNYKGDIRWYNASGAQDYANGSGASLTFDDNASSVATWDARRTIINYPVSFQGSYATSGEPSVSIRGDYNHTAIGGIPVLKIQNYYNSTGTRASITNYSYNNYLTASVDFINVDQNYKGMITFNTSTSSGGMAERIRIEDGGNVGVGLTNPAAKLSVGGGDFEVYRASGSAPVISLFQAGVVQWTIKNVATSGDLLFEPGSAKNSIWKYDATKEGMRISSTGLVAFGTTAPAAKVDIVGKGASNSTAGLVVRSSSGASYFYAGDGGGIGIGTTAPGTWALNVANDVYVADTLSAGTIVDRTPWFEGDAVAAFKAVGGKAGKRSELDHASLPVGLQAKFKENRYKDRITGEIMPVGYVPADSLFDVVQVEETGRDVGATISMLIRAVQQLSARADSLDAKVKKNSQGFPRYLAN